MGPFKKYVICIMAFFAQFDFNTLLLPLCYSLNFTKKLQNEREEDFLHVWLLQRITFPVDTGRKFNVLCTFNLRPASTGLYQRRQKIRYLDKFNFQTHGAYKQTTLAKQWHNIVVQISYSYFRYTSWLFLRCAVFVALCNIIRAL